VEEIGFKYTAIERSIYLRVSRTVYDELRNRTRRPLLPTLARICLGIDWNGIELSIVPMFLTEKVTYLRLGNYRGGCNGKDLQAWCAAKAQAPFIESLMLHGYHSLSCYKTEGTSWRSFITGLQHLKHFESTSFRLPDETIRYLTSLPSLRSLVIPIKDFRDLARICDPNSNPSYTPQLSSLQTLHILCDSLNPRGSSIALRSMNPTSLRELRISSCHDNLSIRA